MTVLTKKKITVLFKVICLHSDDVCVRVTTVVFCQPIDPLEVAVVTPAAMKEVVFEGGPAPWVLDSSRYYRSGKL